jgi:hypothetical protein
MTPSRDSPRSFSSVATMQKRWTRAAAAAAAPLLLLALAGRADATCTVYVHNDYRVPVTMDAYDGGDDFCLIATLEFGVNGLGGCTS